KCFQGSRGERIIRADTMAPGELGGFRRIQNQRWNESARSCIQLLESPGLLAGREMRSSRALFCEAVARCCLTGSARCHRESRTTNKEKSAVSEPILCDSQRR